MTEPFVALVVYPTTAEAQSRQADTVTRALALWASQAPGLISTEVLVSEDGESIVTLTRWNSRDSFDRFRQGELGQAVVGLASNADPKSYRLRVHGVGQAS